MYRFPAYILIKVINDNQLICIKISIISFQQSSIDESIVLLSYFFYLTVNNVIFNF